MVSASHSESSCQSPIFNSALGSSNKTGSGAEKEVVRWKVGPASRSAGSLAHMKWCWEVELMWYVWIVDLELWILGMFRPMCQAFYKRSTRVAIKPKPTNTTVSALPAHGLWEVVWALTLTDMAL